MSPVFIDTQRLSYDNYGSKNDRFGWPLNRRYEKCKIFANLNDFNFFCFLNETVSFWTRVRSKEREFLLHSYKDAYSSAQMLLKTSRSFKHSPEF